MTLGIITDTETTGLPDFKSPSDGADQPHVVQLACKLVNIEAKKELASMNLTSFPSGWVIPPETTEIHGISNHLASQIGIQEGRIIESFLALAGKADVFIAHNVNFDARILRIAIMRTMGRATADEFKKMPKFCTCNKSRPLLPKGERATLGNVLRIFTGEGQSKAHDAWGDVIDCEKIFFELVKRDVYP